MKADVTDTTIVPRYYGHDRRVRSTDARRSLTSQTKLTLTLTLLNANSCVQIVDTHDKFFRIYKRNFRASDLAGFVGAANYCTTS